MLPLLLAACWSDDPTPTPPPIPTPPVRPPPAPLATAPLPAPLLGVSEVPTPPDVLRATEIRRTEPPRRLDVEVDPDIVPFDDMKARLTGWGFTVEDGDGRAWRVRAPDGLAWLERLDPLQEVIGVRFATTQDLLEDGAARTGSEHYGTTIRTWSMKDGQLTTAIEGITPPPEEALPIALPAIARRCLSPVMEAMAAGEAQGIGWERALRADGSGWVLVAEHLAPCDVTGWVGLRADAPVADLNIADRRAAEVDEAAVFAAAVTWLGQERAWGEAATELAMSIVASAPDEELREAFPRIGDPRAQAELWDVWSQRDPAMALDYARTSDLTAIRARAAAQDRLIRRGLLLGETTPTFARRTAVTGWSATADDAPLLDRLREDRDPVVRAGAWGAWIEKNATDCANRAKDAAKQPPEELGRLYAECPQDEVRGIAFEALRAANADKAAEAVARVLARPETMQSGLDAVRAAASMRRDDLLEQVVADPHLARDIRRLAFQELKKGGRSKKVDTLRDTHGAYLGVAVARPAVADG